MTGLKFFLLLTIGSLMGFVVSVVLHKAIGALFGGEELAFFLLAVIAMPIVFAVGVLGSLIAAVGRGWKKRARGGVPG